MTAEHDPRPDGSGRLRVWLTERVDSVGDPARGFDRFMEQVAATPQGHVHQRAGSRAGTHRRRFLGMFTMPRLMGLAAIVALGGSSLFLLGPSPSPEPVDAQVDPTWVTGTIAFGSDCEGPTITPGAVQIERGYRCGTQLWTTDDPRLTGTAITTWNADVHRTADGPISVRSGVYDVTTVDGSWRCAFTGALAHGSGLLPVWLSDEQLLCTGGGANEGLSAVLMADFSRPPYSITGLVFSGQVTPLP